MIVTGAWVLIFILQVELIKIISLHLLIPGENISLYLPANVGEQIQKSGGLGKSFLYLKVF